MTAALNPNTLNVTHILLYFNYFICEYEAVQLALLLSSTLTSYPLVCVVVADEQEADGHRFMREIRTNMKAPAVKATGKETVCVFLWQWKQGKMARFD